MSPKNELDIFDTDESILTESFNIGSGNYSIYLLHQFFLFFGDKLLSLVTASDHMVDL